MFTDAQGFRQKVVSFPHSHYTDKGTDTDLDKIITDLVKTPGTPSPTFMKLQYEEFRITCKTGNHNLHSDMNDRDPGFFHSQFMSTDTHV